MLNLCILLLLSLILSLIFSNLIYYFLSYSFLIVLISNIFILCCVQNTVQNEVQR